MQREFDQIINMVHEDIERNPKAFHSIIKSSFGKRYSLREWGRELIARVPHLIAQHGAKKAEEILLRHQSTKSLLEFYRSHVENEIRKFIAEGPLEDKQEPIYRLNNKFDLLRQYLEYDLEFCEDENIDPHQYDCLLVYSSNHPFLTFLKVARSLNCAEPNNKFYVNNIFCTFRVFAEKYHKVHRAFRKFQWCKTLFVLCAGMEGSSLPANRLNNLFTLASISGKRVILFIPNKFLSQTQLFYSKFKFPPTLNCRFIGLSSRRLDIRDLAQSSQNWILAHHITFLGEKVRLNNLIGDDDLQLIEGNFIDRLLNEEQITVGKDSNCVDNFWPGFVSYYESLSVERLCKFVDESTTSRNVVILVGHSENYPEEMKFKLCELYGVDSIDELYVSPADQFSDEEETRGLIRRHVLLVHSRSDYDYSHLVDLLQNHRDWVCFLIHIEYEETIYSDLLYAPSLKLNRKLLNKGQRQRRNGIDENDFVNRLTMEDNRVFVLSDDAGSGKSYFLRFIQLNLDQNPNTYGYHAMKFILRECTSFIDKYTLEPDLNVEDALRFLCTFGQINDTFGRQMFRSYIKNSSKSPIILLMDGFDEIGSSESNDASHNKEKIANLIKCLIQYTSVYAVITTRSESEACLVSILCCPVFIFKSIKEKYKEKYMTRYCQIRTSIRTSRWTDPVIPDYLKIAFTDSPLHINMASELLLEMVRNELSKEHPTKDERDRLIVKFLTLDEFYRDFINMRYKVYFREKKNSVVDNRTKDICNFTFQKLALFSLYGNQEFIKDCFLYDPIFRRWDGRVLLDTDKVSEYFDVGMISYFSDSSIEFIHRTFAEYFVVQLFISWLREKHSSETAIAAIFSNLPEMELQKESYLGSYVHNFLNLTISPEEFTDNVLEAHHSAMEKFGVEKTEAALHAYSSCGYYRIIYHIMKCWAKVDKFHEIVRPTKHDIAGSSASRSHKQTLMMLFSVRYLNFYDPLLMFHHGLCGFCLAHRYGVQEFSLNADLKSVYSITFLENGEVGILDVLLNVMISNGIISPDNKIGKLMHLGISSGNIKVVKWMENEGGDIFAKTDKGTSTVAYAIRKGQYEVAEWLQERGVKIRESTNQGSTVIHEACVSVHLSKYLRRLITNGEDHCSEAIELMCYLAMKEPWGHEETLELLRALTKLGSGLRICSRGGVTALHSAAVAANDQQIFDCLTSQGLFAEDHLDDTKSAFHTQLNLGLLSDSTDNELDLQRDPQNFICDLHLLKDDTVDEKIMINRHKNYIRSIESDNMRHSTITKNPNDEHFSFSEYKNIVLQLILVVEKCEGRGTGVITLCGEVMHYRSST
ncbi:hypothetical protein GE061_014057 [Apolygus lucorum]|uniref:NACHT domain-containing protein n=1 Tax=Apolygus lucorum TaxID=248454 RepID=A0A8S9XQP8_APOLU|nr:hypothetical protein GE061_014057 [Apolygus lucorum]